MKLKTHISLSSALRIRFRVLKDTAVITLFLVLMFIIVPSEVNAQDVVSWRAEASSGEWDWGASCDSDGNDGHWNWVDEGGYRKRPDCYAAPKKIYFSNNNRTSMKLNSDFDYTVNQIIFDISTESRTIGSDVGRSIYFKQNNLNL